MKQKLILAFRPKEITKEQLKYIMKVKKFNKTDAIKYSINILYHLNVCGKQQYNFNYCPYCGIENLLYIKGLTNAPI